MISLLVYLVAKQNLVSVPVLVHFDPNLPLCMAGDASAYGNGAVLSHVMSDGSERPVAYASCTLLKSERNYAQVEKEALSLIFGIKKFHQYLYGKRFTMITNHQPLTTILGPKQGIPTLAAARMQRWALQLSAYNYDIQFHRTQDHDVHGNVVLIRYFRMSQEPYIAGYIRLCVLLYRYVS